MPRRSRPSRSSASSARTATVKLANVNIGRVLGSGKSFVKELQQHFRNKAITIEWRSRQDAFYITSEQDHLIAKCRSMVQDRVYEVRDYGKPMYSAYSSRQQASRKSDSSSAASMRTRTSITTAQTMRTANPFAALMDEQVVEKVTRVATPKTKTQRRAKPQTKSQARPQGASRPPTSTYATAFKNAAPATSPSLPVHRDAAPTAVSGWSVKVKKAKGGKKKKRRRAAPQPAQQAKPQKKEAPKPAAQKLAAIAAPAAAPETEDFPELAPAAVLAPLAAPDSMARLGKISARNEALRVKESKPIRSEFAQRRSKMRLANQSDSKHEVAIPEGLFGMVVGGNMGGGRNRNLAMLQRAVRDEFNGARVGIRKGNGKLCVTGNAKNDSEAMAALTAITRELVEVQKAKQEANQAEKFGALMKLAAHAQPRDAMARCHKRLQHDLAEALAMDAPGISVHVPDEKVPHVWHVNFLAPEGSEMQGLVVHCQLKFPKLYPIEPPSLMLFPNGSSALRRRAKRAIDNDCLEVLMRGGNAWSAAYTAAGVLMQVQSFLFPNERIQGNSEKDRERLVEAIKAYECKGCGHCAEKCVPHLPEVVVKTSKSTKTKALTLREQPAVTWRMIFSWCNDETLFAAIHAFPQLDRVCGRCASLKALRETRCFFSRDSARSSVLGMGLAVHNKSGQFCGAEDSVITDGDLLSLDIWKDGIDSGVRGRGEQGQKAFTHFLPLAIDRSHFKRAVKSGIVQEALKALSGKKKTTAFDRLQTICGLMKHVALSFLGLGDGAQAVKQELSYQNVLAFCRLHHLLLAIDAETNFAMKKEAMRRLRTFASPGGATKALTPDLGILMMYLALVSEEEMGWANFCDAFVNEGMIRGHKFTTMKEPKLDQPEHICGDQERVDRTFQLRTVGLRIHLFLRAFMNNICRWRTDDGKVVTPAEMLNYYNAHCGEPPAAQMTALFEGVQNVFKLERWRDYFAQMGCSQQPKTLIELAQWLKATRLISVNRGYHTPQRYTPPRLLPTVNFDDDSSDDEPVVRPRTRSSRTRHTPDRSYLRESARPAAAVACDIDWSSVQLKGQKGKASKKSAKRAGIAPKPQHRRKADVHESAAILQRIQREERRAARVTTLQQLRETEQARRRRQRREDERAQQERARARAAKTTLKAKVDWSNCPDTLEVKETGARDVAGTYVRRGVYGEAPVWERKDGAFRIFAWPSWRGSWWLSRKITSSYQPDFYKTGVAAYIQPPQEQTWYGGRRNGCLNGKGSIKIKKAKSKSTF